MNEEVAAKAGAVVAEAAPAEEAFRIEVTVRRFPGMAFQSTVCGLASSGIG